MKKYDEEHKRLEAKTDRIAVLCVIMAGILIYLSI